MLFSFLVVIGQLTAACHCRVTRTLDPDKLHKLTKHKYRCQQILKFSHHSSCKNVLKFEIELPIIVVNDAGKKCYDGEIAVGWW